MDRIREVKAADPMRRNLAAIFEAWWSAHGDAVMKSSDLADTVTSLMKGPQADRPPSRQDIACFCDRHNGTRIAGYVLEQIKDESRVRTVTYYKLKRSQ